MFDTLREDIRTVFKKDPAARSTAEVIFFYPGLHALWMHRKANWFWRHNLKFFATWIAFSARFLTNIEIHPGAKIGRRFFIDHGAGVVIGETAEIGDDVLLYQGVVLGGTTHEKKKRHPTIGNDVVVGTGAIVLGPLTVGDGARIGAGSVVIDSVPAGATVVGIPGRVVGDRHKPVQDLQHAKMPDPVAEAIRLMLREQDKLGARLAELEKMSGIAVTADDLMEEKKHVMDEFKQGDGI